MAPNIYDFTVLLREQFDFREKRERKIEENYSLSNIEVSAKSDASCKVLVEIQSFHCIETRKETR